jgi:hypothetical protein
LFLHDRQPLILPILSSTRSGKTTPARRCTTDLRVRRLPRAQPNPVENAGNIAFANVHKSSRQKPVKGIEPGQFQNAGKQNAGKFQEEGTAK